MILDVLGGLLPVIVDAATGAWKGIEQGACDVNLPAAESPESIAWTSVAKENGWVLLEAAS